MILNYFPTHKKNYDFKREPIKEKKKTVYDVFLMRISQLQLT